MLRLVIQVSMFLAIPLMAVCLYWKPQLTPWYLSYTLVFNMLVGPVFSAGSVTSERERETLELLLTTIISPWQILWGKLVSGLRVSSVLTSFLLWPLLLACIMVPYFWSNLLSIAAYVGIVGMTCLTTGCVALFSSVFFKKTATSLMTTYLVIVLLFCAPVAMEFFATTFFPRSPLTLVVRTLTVTSPFAATFSVPLSFDTPEITDINGSWAHVASYFGFSGMLNAGLMGLMIWLFNTRWRVAE
jgi:ABC-type transport system involved in multi-copper enzyme maturation permease subunit